MEARDLVLLMLIPFIVVSLIIYIGKYPVITGAAISQKQEANNLIGTYSIMPSFKTKLDYEMEEEYQKISSKLGSIIKKCQGTLKTINNFGECLKDSANKEKWNCDEEASDILYDFLYKLQECLNIEDDKAVCRFSFEERELKEEPKVFTISLISENQRTKAELIHKDRVIKREYLNLENLFYTGIDNKDEESQKAFSIKIKVKYEGKKPIIDEEIAQDALNNFKIISLSRTLFYKSGKNIKFIDASVENLFRVPGQGTKIIDVPRKTGLRFCVKSKTNVNIYNEFTQSIETKPITYKFAVTYPSSPIPPPVNQIKAFDKEKAEKSIILKWGKAKWDDGTEFDDFDHYNIYCSKVSRENSITKEILLEFLEPTMAIKSKDKDYDIWVADVNKCGKEDIEDGEQYYFIVTTIAKSGKESRAIKQAVAKSVDDLAPGVQDITLINSDGSIVFSLSYACVDLPVGRSDKPGIIWVGFFPPEYNEDELTKVPIGEQLTYHLHFSKQNPITQNLQDCNDKKKCQLLTFAPKDNPRGIQPEFEERRFHKDREIDDSSTNNLFKEGEKYCFTIVAQDKNKNVIKNLPYHFEKPSQWKELESKPVKKGFFNEKGEIIYS